MQQDAGDTQQSQKAQELKAYASAFVLHSLHDVWKAMFKEILAEQSKGGVGNVNIEKAVQETNKRHAMVVDSLFTGALSQYFAKRDHGDVQEALKIAGITKQNRDALVLQTARKPGHTMQDYVATEVNLEPRANYVASKREVAALRFIQCMREKLWNDCLAAKAEAMLATGNNPSGNTLLQAADAEYNKAMAAIYSGQQHALVGYTPESLEDVLTVSAAKEAEVRDLDTLSVRQSVGNALAKLTPPATPLTQTGGKLAAEDYRIDLEIALGRLMRINSTQVAQENLDTLAMEYMIESELLVKLASAIEGHTGLQQPAAPSVPASIQAQQISIGEHSDRQAIRSWRDTDWQQAVRDELWEVLEDTGLRPKELEAIIKDFSIAQYDEKYFNQPELLEVEIQQTYIILSMLSGITNPRQRLAIFQEACSKDGTRIRLGGDDRADELTTWIQLQGGGAHENKDKEGKKQVKNSITVAYDESIQEYVATIKVRDDSLLSRILRAIVSFLSKYEAETGVRHLDKFVDKVRNYAVNELDPLADVSHKSERISVEEVRKARFEARSQLHAIRHKDVHEHKDVIKEIIEHNKPQDGKHKISHTDGKVRGH